MIKQEYKEKEKRLRKKVDEQPWVTEEVASQKR